MPSYYGPSLPNYRDWLAHAVITEKRIVGDDSIEKAVINRDRAGEEQRAGKTGKYTKALANREWYQAHKAEKAEYNRQYYQKHKEYWQQWYKFNRDAAKARRSLANEASGKADVAKRRYGANSEQYKKAAQTAKFNWDAYYRNVADLKASKINLERATRDYDDYVSQHSKTSFKELWKLGASGIIDTGKKVVTALLGKIKR